MFVKNFINEFQFGTLCKSAGREFHSVKAQYNGDLRWISFFGRGKRIIWWLRCGIECVDAGTVQDENVPRRWSGNRPLTAAWASLTCDALRRESIVGSPARARTISRGMSAEGDMLESSRAAERLHFSSFSSSRLVSPPQAILAYSRDGRIQVMYSWRMINGFRRFRSRRRNPTLAEAALTMVSTWLVQPSVSEKVTPRCRWCETCGTWCESTVMQMFTACIFLERKTITADFVGFTVRCHLANHIERESVRSWSFDSNKLGTLSVTKDEVSSANRFVDFGKGMSFMYIEKSRGLKIAPWGTPANSFADVDIVPLTIVIWWRSARKLTSQRSAAPSIPAARSFTNSPCLERRFRNLAKLFDCWRSHSALLPSPSQLWP